MASCSSLAMAKSVTSSQDEEERIRLGIDEEDEEENEEEDDEDEDFVPPLLSVAWLGPSSAPSQPKQHLPVAVFASSELHETSFALEKITESLRENWKHSEFDGSQSSDGFPFGKFSELTRRFSTEEFLKGNIFSTLKGSNFMAEQDIQGELAALKVKCDLLQTEVKDRKTELALREAKIAELQSESNRWREESARASGRASSLEQQFVAGVEESDSLRKKLKRKETEADSERREAHKLKLRLDHLDSRLRRHLLGREEAEQRALLSERKLSETLTSLQGLLGMEGKSVDSEVLIKKVTCLQRDNAQLHARLVAMGAAMATHQGDKQATDRALSHLFEEMKEEKNKLRRCKDKEQEERHKREDVERELSCVHKELNQLKAEHSALEHLEHVERKASDRLNSLLETLADSMSTRKVKLSATEEAIKDHVDNIVMDLTQQEQELETLRSQLESAKNSFNRERDEVKRMELEVSSSRERVAIAEAEIRTARRDKDAIRISKSEYEALLRRIQEVVWMGEEGASNWPIGEALVERVTMLMAEASGGQQVALLRRRERTLQGELKQKSHMCEILERERDEQAEQAQMLRMDVERLNRKMQQLTFGKDGRMEMEVPKMRQRQLHSACSRRSPAHPKRPGTSPMYKGNLYEHRINEDYAALKSNLLRILGVNETVQQHQPSDADILINVEKLIKGYRDDVIISKSEEPEARTLCAIHKR